MGKRERVGDRDHPRPRKRRCRRVHFREDVKKHDGLRPDTRIFEEVRISFSFFRFVILTSSRKPYSKTAYPRIHGKW